MERHFNYHHGGSGLPVERCHSALCLGIQAFWAEHGDTIRAKAIEIWQAIRDFIGAAIEWISATVTTVVAALQAFWLEHGDTIKAKALEVWEFIKETISNLLGVIEAIWLAFIALFNGEWEEFGARLWDVWKLAWEAVLDYITGLWALMKPILESVWESLKSWWGSIDWPQLGRDIITGIVAGMQAAGSAITDFLRGLITAAIGDLASLLGIASPSRVMAELIGEPMGEGILSGWRDALLGGDMEASLQMAIAPMAMAMADDSGPISSVSYTSSTTVNTSADPLRVLRASRHLDALGAML
jgi:hypothetical protein